MRGSKVFVKCLSMEKFEFQKNLEKKRAYTHFMMIFLGLLLPTLFSVFKKINMSLVAQILFYGGFIAVICFFYFKAQLLEYRLNKIKNKKI